MRQERSAVLQAQPYERSDLEGVRSEQALLLAMAEPTEGR